MWDGVTVEEELLEELDEELLLDEDDDLLEDTLLLEDCTEEEVELSEEDSNSLPQEHKTVNSKRQTRVREIAFFIM